MAYSFNWLFDIYRIEVSATTPKKIYLYFKDVPLN